MTTMITDHAARSNTLHATDEQLVESLNRLLAHEHACAVRYASHAALVRGPYAETVAARLQEIAGDEVEHAARLRERILALGGTPTLEVDRDGLMSASGLDEILAVNIAEEEAAVRDYTELLSFVPQRNVILHQTLRELVRDEQEHVEELEALRRGG